MLWKARPYLLKVKVEEDFTAVTLTVNGIGFLDRDKQRAQAFQKQGGPERQIDQR